MENITSVTEAIKKAKEGYLVLSNPDDSITAAPCAFLTYYEGVFRVSFYHLGKSTETIETTSEPIIKLILKGFFDK